MTNFTDLNDERDFPTWDHLPGELQFSPSHHTLDRGSRPGVGHKHTPKRHWCFLGEIQSFDNFLRYRTIVKDGNGESLVVAFYFDDYGTFDFIKLQKGHTLAIMYAHQRSFMDGSTGIRVERPQHVRIFPMGLEQLQWLSTDMQSYGKATDGQWKCQGCDKLLNGGAVLNRCGRCRAFCYCNKDCQVKGWNEKGHKKVCKVLQDSGWQAMTKLEFSTYESPLVFPKD